MSFKIVSDSSSDVAALNQTAFASVPLMITAGARTFVDDGQLDVNEMITALKNHKGRSVTACPSPTAWLEAFGDAEEIVCFTITSALSGTYHSAQIARAEYIRLHPERRVLVVDSLSTGPEMELLIEKTEELHLAGRSFEEIQRELAQYQQSTRLIFSLQSLRNLANNGRVSPAMAALAGLLGIRVIGCASEKGELESLCRCRGERRTLDAMTTIIREKGYKGGKVRISYCCSEEAAGMLKEGLKEMYPQADIQAYAARGLCSFYAEEGGMIVGFET